MAQALLTPHRLITPVVPVTARQDQDRRSSTDRPADGCRLAIPDVMAVPGAKWFEKTTDADVAPRHTSQDPMAILLAAAARPVSGARGLLGPIWAEEAMHRAYGLLRLFIALRRPRHPQTSLNRHLQICLATDLAAWLELLDRQVTKERAACGTVLREIVRDLVSLFGPGIGCIDLHCNIEHISLPGHRRRALVLLTWELVVNALLHAFVGQRQGQIVVALTAVTQGVAQLCVRDDGVGLQCSQAPRRCSVAGSLAAVLDTEIHYGSNRRSTLACLYFEIQPPAG
jgi:hypothetical protein